MNKVDNLKIKGYSKRQTSEEEIVGMPRFFQESRRWCDGDRNCILNGLLRASRTGNSVGETEQDLRDQNPAYVRMHEWARRVRVK